MKEIKFNLNGVGKCRLYLDGGNLKLDAGCKNGLSADWDTLKREMISSVDDPKRWSFFYGVIWMLDEMKTHIVNALEGGGAEPPVELKIGQRWRWVGDSRNFLYTLTPTGLINVKGNHPWMHSIKRGSALKMAFCDRGGEGAPCFDGWTLVEDMP